jgi:cysteinyl-tRNA synthetase
VTLHELLHTDKFGGRSWPGEVLRLAMLMTHYRQPIDFTLARLQEAHSRLRRYYMAYETYGNVLPSGDISSFISFLKDDLDTHRALDELNRFCNNAFGVKGISDEVAGESEPPRGAEAVGRMLRAAHLVGLLQLTPAEWKAESARSIPISADKVQTLIDARTDARAAKNWAESDRIRDELAAMGVVLKDNKDGTTAWEVKR